MDWTSLHLQGKLARVPSADHSVSPSVFSNAAIGEDIIITPLKQDYRSYPLDLTSQSGSQTLSHLTVCTAVQIPSLSLYPTS